MLLRRNRSSTKANHVLAAVVLLLPAVLSSAAAQLSSQWFIPANQGRVIAMDGNLQTFPGEWSDASWIKFDQSPYPPQRVTQPPGPDLYTIYSKTYSDLFYVAWNMTESDPIQGSIEILIDPNYDRSSAPMPDHILLHIERSGGATVYRGTGSGWEVSVGASWIHAERNRSWGWQGEIEIPLSDLIGVEQELRPMGIAFRAAGSGTGFWPSSPTFNTLAPYTWGTLLFPTHTAVTATVLTTSTSAITGTTTETSTTTLYLAFTTVSTLVHSTTHRETISETLTKTALTSETKTVITTKTSTQTTTRSVQIGSTSTLVLEERLVGVPSWTVLVAALAVSIAILFYALLRGERP